MDLAAGAPAFTGSGLLAAGAGAGDCLPAAGATFGVVFAGTGNPVLAPADWSEGRGAVLCIAAAAAALAALATAAASASSLAFFCAFVSSFTPASFLRNFA